MTVHRNPDEASRGAESSGKKGFRLLIPFLFDDVINEMFLLCAPAIEIEEKRERLELS